MRQLVEQKYGAGIQQQLGESEKLVRHSRAHDQRNWNNQPEDTRYSNNPS
jgi:hypothetical protein